MSLILLEELRNSPLEQVFSVKKRKEIYAIRPNLLFFNDPTGSFTLSLNQGAKVLGSATLTMSEILTEAELPTGQYHWGTLRFLFDNPIVLNKYVDYTLELSASGYSFSESSYLGWIKSYENKLNNFIETVNNDFENPYDFEIYSFKG